MWPFIISALTILVLSFMGFAYLGERAQAKVARETESLLKEMDSKYENFIQMRLTLSVLKQENPDLKIKEMSEKALIILKPEIDGILAFINATTYSNIPVKPSSKYFRGAASIASALFRKTGSGNNRLLQLEDEEKFRQVFFDSIRSDLTRRSLELKAGNYLD